MPRNTYTAEEAALHTARDIEWDESGDDESEEEEIEIQSPTNPIMTYQRQKVNLVKMKWVVISN